MALSVALPKHAVFITQSVVSWIAQHSAGNVMVQEKQDYADMVSRIRLYCLKCKASKEIEQYASFLKSDNIAGLKGELEWCEGHKHLEPEKPKTILTPVIDLSGDRKLKVLE